LLVALLAAWGPALAPVVAQQPPQSPQPPLSSDRVYTSTPPGPNGTLVLIAPSTALVGTALVVAPPLGPLPQPEACAAECLNQGQACAYFEFCGTQVIQQQGLGYDDHCGRLVPLPARCNCIRLLRLHPSWPRIPGPPLTASAVTTIHACLFATGWVRQLGLRPSTGLSRVPTAGSHLLAHPNCVGHGLARANSLW